MLNPHASAFLSSQSPQPFPNPSPLHSYLLPPPPLPPVTLSPGSSDEDLDFRKFMSPNSPAQSEPDEEHPALNQKGESSDQFITNDSDTMKAFMNESPYSFRNPIFFSVPCTKSSNTLLREPKMSRKLLFHDKEKDKPKERISTIEQKQQIKDLFSQASFSRKNEDVKENEAPKAQTPNPNKMMNYKSQFRQIAPRNLFPAMEAESVIKARTEKLRGDLEETPRSKNAYREFNKRFKEKEKEGFKAAREYSLLGLFELPERVHYRALLDLAEFAKRESKFEDARMVFKLISHLQPFAYQSWLECSKMEEECGNLEKARKLLKIGLKFQPLHENLFTRALKLEEKCGSEESVRALLSGLAQANPRAHYKLFVEAAFFEARAGKTDQARPIYHDFVKLEARLGNLQSALRLCVEGLSIQYKHTPLCFEILRVAENLAQKQQLPFNEVEGLFSDALMSVQHQSYWKLCLEIAQIYSRWGRQQSAEEYIGEAALNCNESISWKIWVYAARMKVRNAQFDTASKLLGRACESVQHKQSSIVLLELAKYHEYRQNHAQLRKVLSLARTQAKTDWKIFFESILAETRHAHFDEALKQVKAALEIHFATGRIWASYVHLLNMMGSSVRAYQIFKEALYEIPKSGEVWCEGARLYMDPYTEDKDGNKLFSFEEARRCLRFAIQFTPQYGDSFLEMLRLLLLEQSRNPSECVAQEIERLRVQCVHSEPNYGCLWFYCREHPYDTPNDIWERAKRSIEKGVSEVQESIRMRLAGKGRELSLDEKLENSSEHFKHWTAIPEVNRMFREGLNKMSGSERWHVIYGNEPIYT